MLLLARQPGTRISGLGIRFIAASCVTPVLYYLYTISLVPLHVNVSTYINFSYLYMDTSDIRAYLG